MDRNKGNLYIEWENNMVQLDENKDKMSPEQFCYWLQGALELMDPKELTEKQLQIVKDHLGLVFNKVTPDYTVTTTDTVTVPYVNPHGKFCDCSICQLGGSMTAVVC